MTDFTVTTPIPGSITTPDTVETSIGTMRYFDGVPEAVTVSTVYDYLDRSRAVEAFLRGRADRYVKVA
jgi:hypothetical protein